LKSIGERPAAHTPYYRFERALAKPLQHRLAAP
jgi:hypothetical protein